MANSLKYKAKKMQWYYLSLTINRTVIHTPFYTTHREIHMCFERPDWWYELDDEEDLCTDEELDLIYEQYIERQESLIEE